MSLQTADKFMFPSQFTHDGEEWTTVKLCGEGTFSKCFQIRNKLGQNRAVKAYKHGAKYEVGFQNEVQILSYVKTNLKSSLVSYIVNYIDMFTVSGQKCILMDLLDCNLKELLMKHEMEGFSLYLMKKIINDLLSAAINLEEMGIVHGDIKPSNILWNMNSECFQLIDFGISFKSMLCSSFDQPLQSPGYQAPEVLEWNRNVKGNCFHDGEDHSVWLNTSIDVWSIGCVLVYLSTGQQLYSTEHALQIPLMCTNCESKCAPCLHLIRATNLIISSRHEIQIEDVKDLSYIISGFLQCHPLNRFQPSWILKHPFLVASEILEASVTDLLLLPTRVLRLLNMFDEGDSEDIEDIKLDIQDECEKFGKLVSVRTSRKTTEKYNVYIEYMYAENCCMAQSSLTGRYFDKRCVVTTFFPWKQFQDNNLY